MKTKIFVSRVNEGWSEIEIPEQYQHFTYDKLVLVAHTFIKKTSYKGILITQNPSPFIIR